MNRVLVQQLHSCLEKTKDLSKPNDLTEAKFVMCEFSENVPEVKRELRNYGLNVTQEIIINGGNVRQPNMFVVWDEMEEKKAINRKFD